MLCRAVEGVLLLHAGARAGRLAAGIAVGLDRLLLLSGDEQGGDEQKGEDGGERRASTRRPARTRHCTGEVGVRWKPLVGGWAREMAHGQEQMASVERVWRCEGGQQRWKLAWILNGRGPGTALGVWAQVLGCGCGRQAVS